MPLHRMNRKVFVEGALRYPGEIVDIPDAIFQESKSDVEARGPATEKVSSAEARETAALPQVPVAPHGPSSVHADVPQGLPAGSTQRGNIFFNQEGERLVPSTPQNDPALVETMNARIAEAEAAAASAQARAEAAESRLNANMRSVQTGEAGRSDQAERVESMTVADLKAYLDSEGVEYPADAKKDVLKALALNGKPE